MTNEPEWSECFDAIKRRYADLPEGNERRRLRFLDHVRHLGAWENDPLDYPDPLVSFPPELHIAFAVCHSDCGVQEFIVDGGTQECQSCGRLLFRTADALYRRAGE